MAEGYRQGSAKSAFLIGAIIGSSTAFFGGTPSFLFGLFLLLAGTPLMVQIGKRTFDFFEAGTIFLAVFACYSLLLPVWFWVNHQPVDAWTLNTYLWACLVAVIGFEAGYYGPSILRTTVRSPERQLRPLNDPTLAQLRSRALLLLAAGLGLYGTFIAVTGGLSKFLQMGYGGQLYLAYGDKGFLGFGADWVLLSLSLLFLSAVWELKWRPSRWARVLLFLTLVLLGTWGALLFHMGSRGQMLRVVLIIVISLHLTVRRLRVLETMSGLALTYAFFVMYGHVRTLVPQIGIVATLSTMLHRVSLKLLLPTSFGEFVFPPRALWEIIEDRTPRLAGLSYLNIPAIMLPKALFPLRPATLAEWRLQRWYPDLWRSGRGLGFFTVAEGWLNFGAVGVFLQMLVFGLALRFIWAWVQQRRDLGSVFVYAVTVVYLVFTGIRIDMAPLLKGYLFSALFPLLFMVFLPPWRRAQTISRVGSAGWGGAK